MANTKYNMGSSASKQSTSKQKLDDQQHVTYVSTTHAQQNNHVPEANKQTQETITSNERNVKDKLSDNEYQVAEALIHGSYGSGVEDDFLRVTEEQDETDEIEDSADAGLAFTYTVPEKDDAFKEQPVAYRDADGKLKFYDKDAAPSYLVWSVGVAGDRQTSVVVDEDETQTGIESGQEGESEIAFVKKKFWDIPEDSVRETSSDVTDSLLELGTSAGFQSEEGGEKEPAITEFDEADPTLPAPKPPTIHRRDLIPNEDMFKEIDERSVKTPISVQEDLPLLLNYLTQRANSKLDKVRAFYMWITHHINYDTSGYFGYADLKSTEPHVVLQRRLTVCEGYTKLMEYFCRHSGIPVKTISGYVKAFGYQPGDDVTLDGHNAHAWNAVFINNNWFLIDATWGAGFVKTREKKYVPMFNDVYFLTEPKVFITDHFPNMDESQRYNDSWQLLETPLTKSEFLKCVNMDKHGKAWAIEPVSHKTCVIENIENELDILLEETYVPMLDYLAFLQKDGRRLQQYTYTYKADEPLALTHVRMPSLGEFSLQIYGRKKDGDVQRNFEPIVKYVLRCNKAASHLPYPSNHTNYGPVHDLDVYGISEVGDTFHVTNTGELILPIKTARYVDLLPRLYYGDCSEELKSFTFVDYSPTFEFLSVQARLPQEGFYKLALYAQRHEENVFKPFMTYLIENKQPYIGSVFPHAHEHALRFKCCLIEPRIMEVAANEEIIVKLKSPSLVKAKGHETMLTKINETTFEGKVRTPVANSWLYIYGSELEHGIPRMLYSLKTV